MASAERGSAMIDARIAGGGMKATHAEQAVLGVLLAGGPVPDLRPEHFSDPELRRIFRGALDCVEAGEPVDVVTVSERMTRNGAAAEILGTIAALATNAPAATNLPAYAKAVRELALEREIGATLEEVGELVQNGGRLGAREKLEILQHKVAAIAMDAGMPPPRPARRKIVMLSPKDLRAQPVLRDLVDGVLPARGIGAIVGAPGSGKSFLADHCVLNLAAGHSPFPGRRCQHQAAVIIGTEGRRVGRFGAYAQHHRIDIDALPVRVIEQALDLRNPVADIGSLLEALAVAERQIGKIGLLVVDTLARSFAGGNENASEDMGAFLDNMGRITEATGGLVLVLHHVGKDAARGGRGHSSLNGALDVEITIDRKDDGLRVAKVTKLRDGEDGTEFAFRLEAVDLGPHPDPEAEEGQRWSSCVVVPVDEHQKAAPEAPERDSRAGLGPRQKAVLRVLQRQYGELRKNLEDQGRNPDEAVALTAALRTALRTAPKKDRMDDNRITEAIDGLKKRGLVREDPPHIFLI